PAGRYSITARSRAGLVGWLPDAISSFEVTLKRGQVARAPAFVLLHAGVASGKFFNDVNGDSQRQEDSEAGLPGWHVYADVNGNHQQDDTDPQTISNADGDWILADLPQGTYPIRAETRPDWPSRLGGDGREVTINPGAPIGPKPIDAGRQGVLISGTVFHDINGDLHRAATGEEGLAGQTLW